MKRTKKSFLAHYDNYYIVIDFFHGRRGTIHNNYPIEEVVKIASKSSIRGGYCVVYPIEYSNAIIKCIDYIESKKGLGQGISNGTWDAFHANIATFIAEL